MQTANASIYRHNHYIQVRVFKHSHKTALSGRDRLFQFGSL